VRLERPHDADVSEAARRAAAENEADGRFVWFGAEPIGLRNLAGNVCTHLILANCYTLARAPVITSAKSQRDGQDKVKRGGESATYDARRWCLIGLTRRAGLEIAVIEIEKKRHCRGGT
jgi:hypothetical protein